MSKGFDKIFVKVADSLPDLPYLVCCNRESLKSALDLIRSHDIRSSVAQPSGTDVVQLDIDPELIHDSMIVNLGKKNGTASNTLNSGGINIIYIDLKSEDNPYKIGSKIAQRLQNLEFDKLSCILVMDDEHIMQAIESCVLRYPTFDMYKTKDKTKKSKELTFLVEDKLDCERCLSEINHISRNVFFTRRLVNTPGNHLRPSDMATEAYKLEDLGIKCKVLQGDDIKEMECLTGVGQGSSDKSKLIILEWMPRPDKEAIALVGKAVTFDSGGLSIKTPSKHMETMKGDMAGGAAVMGIMRAAAEMKLDHNIVGIVPCAENMISSNCIRPGDILKSYSGQTVEVLNTDAEGRLILCDALSYVQSKYKPSIIVDFATLTGAIVASLGNVFTGIFSNDNDLYKMLHEAGEKTWERVWRMPLDLEYDLIIDSSIADIKNVGDGTAGSTTAAQFLQRFINPGVKWAHLDIAGTSYSENRSGVFHDKFSSGVGVRLMLSALSKMPSF